MSAFGTARFRATAVESLLTGTSFYSSYIQTYIDRDVTDMIPGVDKLLYADFIRAAACRVGQMLNIHDIAQDVGVSDDTAKRWLTVMEKSEIIFLSAPILKQSAQAHR